MFNILVAANKCLKYFIDKFYVSIKDGQFFKRVDKPWVGYSSLQTVYWHSHLKIVIHLQYYVLQLTKLIRHHFISQMNSLTVLQIFNYEILCLNYIILTFKECIVSCEIFKQLLLCNETGLLLHLCYSKYLQK